jgi:hypothetical protein
MGYYRAEDNPVRIRVGPKAQMRGVVLRKIIGGSISGRILDINNLGLAGVQVVAMQVGYLYPSGKRQLQRRSITFFSDDRGDFQARGLRPGTYYLRASMDFPASDALAYYPGTKDELAATPLLVREGEDAIANLRLEVKMKPTFTISGVVTSGIPGVPNKPVLRVFLAQNNDGGLFIDTYNNTAVDRSNGRFEIRNIFAGTYELYPETRDADGRLYTSRTTIDVVDKNIENLTLPAVLPPDVKGRVLLNGEAPGFASQNTTLYVETVRGLSRNLIRGSRANEATAEPAVDRETGEFTIGGLLPGTYKLSVSGMPADAYLEDLRQGNVSVYNEGFTVTASGSDPIQLSVASPGGRVEGVVRGVNQEPVATVRVVLIPQASRRQDTRRFNSTSSDKDGKFLMRGIPPGTYTMYAIDNFPENAWRNAEFMQKYESRGQTVNVAKGVLTTIDLARIPWEVMR